MSSPSYPAIISPPEHYHDNSSYPFNAKIMVVAVVSLLVVTSFVLLLHVYAKWWFFMQSRGRRLSLPDLPPSPPPPMLSQLLHRRFTVDDIAHLGDHGLDPLVIVSLPMFVYKWDGSGTVKAGLECVVCLSLFEENEKGRILPKCHHVFHVDCIDMWLTSHSTCPLCRNKVVVGNMEEAATEVPQISSSPAMADDSGMGHGILLDGSISQMLEIVVEDNTQAGKDSSSSSSSSSCTLSESLKRMLSRSRSESRVFPSSDHVSDR